MFYCREHVPEAERARFLSVAKKSEAEEERDFDAGEVDAVLEAGKHVSLYEKLDV